MSSRKAADEFNDQWESGEMPREAAAMATIVVFNDGSIFIGGPGDMSVVEAAVRVGGIHLDTRAALSFGVTMASWVGPTPIG